LEKSRGKRPDVRGKGTGNSPRGASCTKQPKGRRVQKELLHAKGKGEKLAFPYRVRAKNQRGCTKIRWFSEDSERKKTENKRWETTRLAGLTQVMFYKKTVSQTKHQKRPRKNPEVGTG